MLTIYPDFIGPLTETVPAHDLDALAEDYCYVRLRLTWPEYQLLQETITHVITTSSSHTLAAAAAIALQSAIMATKPRAMRVGEPLDRARETMRRGMFLALDTVWGEIEPGQERPAAIDLLISPLLHPIVRALWQHVDAAAEPTAVTERAVRDTHELADIDRDSMRVNFAERIADAQVRAAAQQNAYARTAKSLIDKLRGV